MSQTYEFHYRHRYKLAPNDPLFLDATFEDCIIDYWAHRHWEDPELRTRGTTQDWNKLLDEMEAQLTKEAAERLSHALDKDVEATPEAVLAAAKGKGDEEKNANRLGTVRRKPSVPAPDADDWEPVFDFSGRR